MDREQILNLYEWEPGVCFRHPGHGEVMTAHVGTLRPAAGGIQDVRACRECVVELEGERVEAARRLGKEYAPGGLKGDE